MTRYCSKKYEMGVSKGVCFNGTFYQEKSQNLKSGILKETYSSSSCFFSVKIQLHVWNLVPTDEVTTLSSHASMLKVNLKKVTLELSEMLNKQ